jgi:hypothetical protein
MLPSKRSSNHHTTGMLKKHNYAYDLRVNGGRQWSGMQKRLLEAVVAANSGGTLKQNTR